MLAAKIAFHWKNLGYFMAWIEGFKIEQTGKHQLEAVSCH